MMMMMMMKKMHNHDNFETWGKGKTKTAEIQRKFQSVKEYVIGSKEELKEWFYRQEPGTSHQKQEFEVEERR